MDKREILQLLKDGFRNNSIQDVYDLISNDCIYVKNGSLVISGKKRVEEFLKSVQTSCINIDFKNYASIAKITKSDNDSFPVGDLCLAMAQADEYNCTGIMNVYLNSQDKIKRIFFSTDPEIYFEISDSSIKSFRHMPKDGHEAIRYRAMATDLPDPNKCLVSLSEEDKLYYEGLISHTISDCMSNNKSKTIFPVALSSAAYLFTLAMARTAKNKLGKDILIFNDKSPAMTAKPVADADYQEWMDIGYESGKWLFFGFTEYADIRKPDNEEFFSQFRKCLWDLVYIGIAVAEEDIKDGSCTTDSVPSIKLKTEFLQYFKGIVNNDKNHMQHANTIQDIFNRNINLLSLTGDSKPGRLRVVSLDDKLWITFFSSDAEIPENELDNVAHITSKAILDAVFFNPFIDGIIIDPFTLPLKIPKKMLLQCMIHGTLPKELPPLRKQTDLPPGIPSYTEDELINEQQINSIAFQAICVKEIQQDKHFKVVSFNDTPKAIPGLVLENNGRFTFVYIKGYISKKAPPIPKKDADKIRELAEQYNADCAYATVKIYSVDDQRAEAGLALAIDKFYCKYAGLKKI